MPPKTTITRRRLLASAGVGAAGLGLAGGGLLAGRQLAEASAEGTGSVAFYGDHQAGSPPPRRTASTSPPSTC